MIFLTGGHLVILAEQVLAEIRHFTGPDETDLEAGGILLGCYRGPHVEILECTKPMPLDSRARYRFVRRDPGHQRAALAAWKASDRTVNFVGEWHTHPEKNPTPSHVDRSTWADLMERRKSDPLIFIIAGSSAIYCGAGLEGRLTKMNTVSGSRGEQPWLQEVGNKVLGTPPENFSGF
jgi:integrative and conjugative element protein (TIGR02256 family)